MADAVIRMAAPAGAPAVAALRRAWTEERAGAPLNDDGL
jgi:hypothetical protein